MGRLRRPLLRAGGGLLVGLVGLAGLAACTGKPPAAKVAARPAVDPNAGSFVSPARWDYHPGPPASALATLVLPDGSCVFTAESGQRWKTRPGTKTPEAKAACSGKADAASIVAPENLSTLIHRDDGSWLFVGDSGTLFEAQEPLGAFTRVSPPPEPFAKVAGAGSTLLAASLEGRLLRWSSDAGWRPLPKSPVLDANRVFDLLPDADGRVLALGFPEALLTSTDGGATWAAPPVGSVGARTLGRTAEGDLGAQGLFANVVWKPKEKTPLVKGTQKILAPTADLDLPPGGGASAAAVAAGRAVIDGDRYYELSTPDGADKVALLHGRLEGRLDSSPLPDFTACSSLRLGASGPQVVVLCALSSDGRIENQVFRSTDAGVTWGPPFVVAGQEAEPVELAVSPAGRVLATGVCKPAEPPAPCKSGSISLLRFDLPEPEITNVFVAQQSGPARLPAFSIDGKDAYFLSKRGKDDRLNLFVSRDGAETFSPRPIDVAHVNRPVHRSGDDEGSDEQPAEPEGPEVFDVDEQSTLRLGEDGVVGMNLSSPHGYTYVTMEPDGRLLQASGFPVEDAVNMAGAGRRVIAFVGPDTRPVPDGAGGTIFESIDGGATWEEQHAPLAVGQELNRGGLPLSCTYAGCLAGETLTRLGWGGSPAPQMLEKPDAPAARIPATKTPIVCDLSPQTKWSKIDDVWQVGSLGPLPEAFAAMRGRSAWSVLTYDADKGALVAVSATLPESGEGEPRLVSHTLLAGHGRAAKTAMYVSPTQVEGYAAVRVEVPRDKSGNVKLGAPMRNVEVAWENYFEGTSVRAKIPDAGVFAPGDVGGGGTSLPSPQLSITGKGLIVRPHSGSGTPGFFFDTTGKAVPYQPMPWPRHTPTGMDVSIHGTAGNATGEVNDVGLVYRSGGDWFTAIVRLAKGGQVTQNALSLLPLPADSNFQISTTWAVGQKTPFGVSAMAIDGFHQKAWATFFGFRGDGTFLRPEPLPTPFDLPDRPRPCSASERAGVRLEAKLRNGGTIYFAGTRHPVLVNEPRAKNALGFQEPITLLTGDALLHGSPSSPCVAGWDAVGVAKQKITAVLSGGLTHSWLFRLASKEPPDGKALRPSVGKTSGSGASLEWRPMTCHYDPAAHVPEGVYNEAGTLRVDH